MVNKRRVKPVEAPRLPASRAREIAVICEADPRSVQRELREPGSVRGAVGRRIRQLLSSLEPEARS